ncbi:hypothetical protein Tco_0566167 [Tanacetum coccineum]
MVQQVLNQLVEDLLVIIKKLLVLEMIVDESLEMIEDESLDLIKDETLKLDEILSRLSDVVVFSLLLTPLCCDDTHNVTPRVSALAGCDRLVSKPMVIEKKSEGKWIMKKEKRMISKDGIISEFHGYTPSKEEEEEEDEEEEEEEKKEESVKKGSKEASEMGSNSESSGYAASDNEVESDLKSTTMSEPKCKEMEDTCESGV